MKVFAILPLALCLGLSSALTVNAPIVEALKHFHANLLVDLLSTAGLTTTLNDVSQNYTLFAPSDRSILTDLRNLRMSVDDIKKDPDTLKTFLLAHVVPGLHTTNEFFNEKTFTTANGKLIRLNHYVNNNRYYVDGALIQSRNILVQNGVIHQINHILSPIDDNVYQIINSTNALATLKAAIDVAKLDGFLQDQNPITVFAPNDNAFQALGDITNKLLQRPDLLAEILKYHVIPGSLYRAAIRDTDLHTFEEKDQLFLNHHLSYDEVDYARFLDTDFSGLNGVVHVINQVLVPQSLEDQVKNL